MKESRLLNRDSLIRAKRSLAAKKGWATRRAKKEQSKSVKITKWFKNEAMNQIYSTGLEFALVSAKGEQCHPFAFCKDYLQDAIWATLNKKSVSIYGFYYQHGKNPPVDLSVCRVAVRLKKEKGFKEMCEASLRFINKMESDLSFTPSTLHFGGNYKDTTDAVYIFTGSKQWLFSPPMISLYTLSLRVGMTYQSGPWREHFANAKKYIGENDKNYTKEANKGLDKLLKQPITKTFAATVENNYPPNLGTYSLHDRSGIVSFGKNNIDGTVKKNWTQG